MRTCARVLRARMPACLQISPISVQLYVLITCACVACTQALRAVMSGASEGDPCDAVSGGVDGSGNGRALWPRWGG